MRHKRDFVTHFDSLSLSRYTVRSRRSEEHTSELQSQSNLVCRLLLEKKKNDNIGLAIVASQEERPGSFTIRRHRYHTRQCTISVPILAYPRDDMAVCSILSDYRY